MKMAGCCFKIEKIVGNLTIDMWRLARGSHINCETNRGSVFLGVVSAVTVVTPCISHSRSWTRQPPSLSLSLFAAARILMHGSLCATPDPLLHSVRPVPPHTFSNSKVHRLAFAKGHVKVIVFFSIPSSVALQYLRCVKLAHCVPSPIAVSWTVCCGILPGSKVVLKSVMEPRKSWRLTFSERGTLSLKSSWSRARCTFTLLSSAIVGLAVPPFFQI